MPGVETVGKVQFFQLPGDGVIDFFPVMACIDTPETRGTIQDLVSRAVRVIHAPGPDDKPGVLLELSVWGEWHPVTAKVFGYHVVVGKAHFTSSSQVEWSMVRWLDLS